ncbi:potassium channel family protein [Streptomyces sp. NPDC101393]|uniref:potassium channel family protein n=1 Tax=Streptomyces sp. NPDC101393 TaxID=3366141 RepID=UPI00381F4093
MEAPESQGMGTSPERPRSRPDSRRRTLFAVLRCTITATGCFLAYYLLPMDRAFTGGTAAGLIIGLAALVLLLAWHTVMITRSATPRLRALEAVATTVPLFLLLFASAYYLLERGGPGSFSEPLTRTDSLYFALTVFSTVGFGDITARTEAARAVTMAQMAGTILLVAVAARVMLQAVQVGLRRQGTKEQ